MEGIESEGKTVAEAVDAALRRMGLRRDQVEVQILQEASAGFMGIGTRPARVRIVEKRWGGAAEPPAPKPQTPGRSQSRSSAPRAPQAPAPRRAAPERPAPRQAEPRHAPPRERAELQPAVPVDIKAAVAAGQQLLTELLGLMTFSTSTVAADWDAVQERVKLTVQGADAETIVGRDGKTLESLQFLVTLMLSRSLGGPVAAQVDALGYWEKREKEILAQAQQGIESVKSSGKPVRLAPMDPTMRRLVHRNLAGHPDITTASEGEGSWRKIVLKPRKTS